MNTPKNNQIEMPFSIDCLRNKNNLKDETVVEGGNSVSTFAVPNSSDISILSNSVVYDASGQPSVTAVFKIKNSSGKTLKGINVRVQSLW